jgi:lauroyl/myristoyl acyltransferase/mitochondrial fission protein ELM1
MKLPLGFSFVLGKMIGVFLYFNRRKRRIAFRNIKLVFPLKTDYEIKLIIKRSFRNLGLGIVESLIASRLFKYIELRGKENIDKEGGILVAIHEGSWELYNYFIGHNLKYAMFAREQKKKNLDGLLNGLRKEYGLNVCFSLKEAVKNLKNGVMMGLVIDQGQEDKALLIEFFSQLVPTPKGAIYLAKKLNKKIYPCFGYRKKGFSHIVEIGEQIDPEGKTDTDLLKHLNKIYENYLTKHPYEYVWYYKRFKRKKNLDILILSDGKIGHLKQSQALLSIIAAEDYKIESKTIEIKYKNKLARIFSEFCSLFSGRNCIGCGFCLRFLIDKDTFRKLKTVYADIVISTGSIVAPINNLFSSYLGAKSVVILRPNTPLEKFDLCIVPVHDRVEATNAIKIRGALFYPTKIEEKTNECKTFFNLSDQKKISLFLGGPLSNEVNFVNNLKLFIDKLKDFSLANSYKLLISTSRRTPKAVEEYLEKAFSNFRNLEAIVLSNRNNYDFVFDGFASLSEIVFVSSESISMISEVISLKKPCVCVFLEKHIDKHRVFLQSIEQEVTLLSNPYNIEEIRPKISHIFEGNVKEIKEGVKRLL